MADRTYRRGERDRSDRERSYNRQAEQFDADQGWREDERGYGQMGDSWRDDDYHRNERGYRGHGPSGYSRSDERIKEDACDALTDDWRVDARQVSVTVKDGEITLDGTVPSRDQKRRAEDCVDELSGVRHVQNNLRVQERTEWDRGESREFGKRSDAPGSEA